MIRLALVACCWAALGTALPAAAQPQTLARRDGRGWSLLLGGRVDDALRYLLKQAGARDPSPHALGGVGLAYFMRGEAAAAHTYFCRAAVAAADVAEGPVYLGLAELTAPYRQHPDTLLDACRTLAARRSDPVGTGRLAQALLIRRLAAAGDIEGASLAAREAGWIDRWLLAAPFANEEEQGFDQVLPPEQGVDVAAIYEGRHRAAVSWRHVPRCAWDGVLALDELVQPAEQATAFAATYLASNAARVARFAIGHAGATKVWLNGRLVYANPDYHGFAHGQWLFAASLSAGCNELLVKICNKRGPWRLALRMLPDADGSFPAAAVADPAAVSAEARAPRLESNEAAPCHMPPPAAALLEAQLQSDPKNGWPHMALALLAIVYANVDEADARAYEHAQAAAAAYPACSLPWRLAAYHGLTENARITAAQSAMRADPADEAALLTYLSLYANREDYQAARADLETAVRLANARGGASPRLRMAEGRFYERQGVAPAAWMAYVDAARAFPFWSEPRRRMAALASALDVPMEERLRIAREIYAADGDEEAAALYVRALLDVAQVAAAREVVAAHALRAPSQTRADAVLAEALQAQGDLDGARALLVAAHHRAPWRADLLKALGVVEHAAGDEDAARAAWRAALALAGADAQIQTYLEQATERAERFYDRYWIEPADLAEPAVSPAEANAVTLLDQQVVKVFPNGASSRMVHEITRILNEAGARQHQSRDVGFDPARQTLRIIRARATRKDGTVVEAAPPETRSALDPAARVYGDYRVQTVAFRGVEPGALLDFAYELTQTGDNVYSDYFGDIFYFGGFSPVVHTDYVVLMPAERPLYHLLVGQLPDSLEVRPRDQGAVTEYSWQYQNLPLTPYEPDMPPYAELLPHVRVSTFQDWDAMTRWYWSLIRDQFRADAKVRDTLRVVLDGHLRRQGKPALPADMPLEAIPRELLSDAERVAAVNQYVNTDIRYLALSFGVHGYKPHSTHEICSAAYGDCKDKATLAVTMLELLGVRAGLALIRTADLGAVDPALPSLHLFNHAIYYLPEFDGGRFIDGTAAWHGTRELPWGDQGVETLVLFTDGTSRWVRTPIAAAEDNGARFVNTIALGADGKADLIRRAEYRGLYNPTVRALYWNADKRRENIERQWGRRFPGAVLTRTDASDLTTYEDDEWMEYEAALPAYAVVDGSLLHLPLALFPTQAADNYARLSSRQWPLIRGAPPFPWHRRDETVLRVPPGHEPVALPDPLDLATPFGRLRFSFATEAGVLRWTHELVLEATRIEAANYPAFREFCAAIDRLEQQRITLRKTEP